MGKSWLLLLAASLLMGMPGCKSLARPNWFHPGPADYQQARAHQFDPYPEKESGPPIVGARPLEYQNPPPEVQRARPKDLQERWFPWLPFWQ